MVPPEDGSRIQLRLYIYLSGRYAVVTESNSVNVLIDGWIVMLIPLFLSQPDMHAIYSFNERRNRVSEYFLAYQEIWLCCCMFSK
jgi:hypothetical protein